MKVKEMPNHLRPREKLKLEGVSRLDDRELIAIIIGNGSQRADVMSISSNIVKKYDTDSIKFASITELKKIKGVGEITAMKIKAAVELGSRNKKKINFVVRNSKDVHSLCQDMKSLEQEHFVILILDTKNKLVKQQLISIGTLNLTVIHPREIFKEAIRESANSIILVHNHPSGDPTPSSADIDITNKLISAGELLDIKVLDHVIIGEGYYSFKDSNP